MNAERLAQQITEAMAQNADRTLLEKLATEYATQCRVANRRLAQCEDMLNNGNESEPLQLAEAEPSLLDLVAALSFDRSEEWRVHCKSKNLPQAETLNERAVKRLNELYSKGITTNHPLYKQYKTAILERDDTKAISVLRAIVKLNPSDKNAKGEMERLEAKIQDDLLNKLKMPVQKRDIGHILTLLSQIETTSWLKPPSGPILDEAIALRKQHEKALATIECAALIEKATRLREGNGWAETGGLLQRVQSLCQAHQINLDARLAAKMGELFAWVADQRKAHAEELQFQDILMDLQTRISQGETKGARGTRKGLVALREELGGLSGQWRTLEKFGKPIPIDLPARFKRRTQTIETEIARLTKQHNLVVAVSVLAFLVAAWFSGAFALRAFESSKERQGLIESQKSGRLAATEKQIEDLRTKKPKLAEMRLLRIQIAQTQSWIEDEKSKKVAFDSMLSELQPYVKADFSNAPPTVIEKQFQQAKDQSEMLALDFRSESQAQLLEFQNKFDAYLAKHGGELAKIAVALLEKGEKIAVSPTLKDLNKPLDEIRQAVKSLQGVIQELDATLDPAINKVPVPSSILSRKDALREKVSPLKTALEKIEKTELDMRNASSAKDYLTALHDYEKGSFQQVAEVRKAREVLDAEKVLLGFESEMLMPGDAMGWQNFISKPNAEMKPSDTMPAERAKFLGLRDDDNLRNIFRCAFLVEDVIQHEKIVYSRGPLKIEKDLTQGTATSIVRYSCSGNLYEPDDTQDSAVFAAKAYSGIEQKTSDKLVITGLVPAPDSSKVSNESLLFSQIGMTTFVNPSNNRFSTSILTILDRLRADKSINPLFKTYMQQRLLELKDIRPYEWGAQWAPAVALHQKRLSQMEVSELSSGDWMVPRRIAQHQKRLADFYQETQMISYMNQAKFFQRLIQSTHSAGLRYGGFIAPDGRLVLTTEAKSASELAGLAKDSLKPALLYSANRKQEGIRLVADPCPFTPLFYFPVDRAKILQECSSSAGVKQDDPSIKGFLPPYFTGVE